jgi:hypothetical protein
VGYRNQIDLIFRDENTRTEAKAQQSYKSASTSSLDLKAGQASSVLAPAKIHNTSSMLTQGFGISLSSPIEDVAVCEFYRCTLDSLSLEDDTRFLHLQLPALYTQSPLGSVLRLSAQAIAYASSKTLGHRATEMSRKQYVKAIKALGLAIKDPVEIKSDQTLYAVLLLCGFEVSLLRVF